uniref:Protein kinase domain-containing protein n=1 Tax=Ananas comosus var. bracteatus TaxID=296719 RepID=A0A6V7PEI0_ANACO|nr:unnamed protein product [Ananas comosus var. bracteatus]
MFCSSATARSSRRRTASPRELDREGQPRRRLPGTPRQRHAGRRQEAVAGFFRPRRRQDPERDRHPRVHDRLPCIVNLVGAGRDSAGQSFLVMQLMPNGSLRDALRSHSAAPSWPRRVEIALRVARAVASLHGASPPVVHRDVKSENVLFDAAWDARLADFSLAVRVGGGGRTEPIGLPPAGTIGYLDPSYTESKLLSPKNDVFSFGVLLLELVSSRKVMDVDSDTCSIVAWAVPMIRARRYDEVVDRRVGLSAGTERSAVARILRVAARCAAEKAEERPGMGRW